MDFLTFHRTDLPTNSQAYRLRHLLDELFTVLSLMESSSVLLVLPGRAGLARQTVD